MGMGLAPTWLRQVSPLLHMTTETWNFLQWQVGVSEWVVYCANTATKENNQHCWITVARSSHFRAMVFLS